MTPDTADLALDIRPYDLPDTPLLEPRDEPGRCLVFSPPQLMVVIGRGSDPARELNLEAVHADGIPVLRRASGGCAVVLSPDMLAISFALYTSEQGKSSEYFRTFTSLLIRVLERQNVVGLSPAGTSDIALRGRKISGSSIYRNRLLVFYHAILNVAGQPALMERYLAQPPREPDYRAGRAHTDFVTSLAAEGYALSPPDFSRDVENEFQILLSE